MRGIGVRRWLICGLVSEEVSKLWCNRGRNWPEEWGGLKVSCIMGLFVKESADVSALDEDVIGERNEDWKVIELLVGLWRSLQVFLSADKQQETTTLHFGGTKILYQPDFKIGQFIVIWSVHFSFSTCNQLHIYALLYGRIFRHILCILCTTWMHTYYAVFQFDHMFYCDRLYVKKIRR